MITIKLLRVAILLILLFSWEISSRFGLIDTFFFSSPSRIFRNLFILNKNGSILLHTGITLLETLISFVFTIFFSIIVSLLLWYFTKASIVLEPYLVALNSLPKSALAPLLIVWLGTGMKTIIIAGMSVAMFGCIINLYYSFRQSDQDKMKLIYTLGGTKKDVLFRIILPGSIPTIISNMKVNIGLCLVGVIIGEFLAARRGLGYIIIYSTQVFKLDWLILSILVLCIIAMLLYSILRQIEIKILKNYS